MPGCLVAPGRLVAPGCSSNNDHQEHTTTGKERNTSKAGKPEYICMIAGNEKKSKKVKKKFGDMKKPPYLCSRNQTTTNIMKAMKKTNSNNFERINNIAYLVFVSILGLGMSAMMIISTL